MTALTSRDYVGKALALTGPEAFSFADVAAKVGAAIGRDLRYETLSDEEARRRFWRRALLLKRRRRTSNCGARFAKGDWE